MPGATAAPRSGGLFTRMSAGAKARRPESSGSVTGERPLSARGSFVDRLRNMQITSSRPPTGSGSGAARHVGGSTAGRSVGGSTGVTRPPASRTAGPSAGAGPAAIRRPAAKDAALGHASGHSTSASAGIAPTGVRSGRAASPPVLAGRVAASGDAGGAGLRAVGTTSPQLRSPGKLALRDPSPVKTHKPLVSRHSPTGGGDQFRGLKVAITLMTRKPHRFDWCAPHPTPHAALRKTHKRKRAPASSALPRQLVAWGEGERGEEVAGSNEAAFPCRWLPPLRPNHFHSARPSLSPDAPPRILYPAI